MKQGADSTGKVMHM